MGQLKPRYPSTEKVVLLTCVKPFERWTADERRTWVRTGTGFRHFIAPNITPIEHYWPKERAIIPAGADPKVATPQSADG